MRSRLTALVIGVVAGLLIGGLGLVSASADDNPYPETPNCNIDEWGQPRPDDDPATIACLRGQVHALAVAISGPNGFVENMAVLESRVAQRDNKVTQLRARSERKDARIRHLLDRIERLRNHRHR